MFRPTLVGEKRKAHRFFLFGELSLMNIFNIESCEWCHQKACTVKIIKLKGFFVSKFACVNLISVVLFIMYFFLKFDQLKFKNMIKMLTIVSSVLRRKITES